MIVNLDLTKGLILQFPTDEGGLSELLSRLVGLEGSPVELVDPVYGEISCKVKRCLYTIDSRDGYMPFFIELTIVPEGVRPEFLNNTETQTGSGTNGIS